MSELEWVRAPRHAGKRNTQCGTQAWGARCIGLARLVAQTNSSLPLFASFPLSQCPDGGLLTFQPPTNAMVTRSLICDARIGGGRKCILKVEGRQALVCVCVCAPPRLVFFESVRSSPLFLARWRCCVLHPPRTAVMIIMKSPFPPAPLDEAFVHPCEVSHPPPTTSFLTSSFAWRHACLLSHGSTRTR